MYEQVEMDIKNLNTCLPKGFKAVFAQTPGHKPKVWIEKTGIFGLSVFTPQIARIEYSTHTGIVSIMVSDKDQNVRPEIEKAVSKFNDQFKKIVDVF